MLWLKILSLIEVFYASSSDSFYWQMHILVVGESLSLFTGYFPMPPEINNEKATYQGIICVDPAKVKTTLQPRLSNKTPVDCCIFVPPLAPAIATKNPIVFLKKMIGEIKQCLKKETLLISFDLPKLKREHRGEKGLVTMWKNTLRQKSIQLCSPKFAYPKARPGTHAYMEFPELICRKIANKLFHCIRTAMKKRRREEKLIPTILEMDLALSDSDEEELSAEPAGRLKSAVVVPMKQSNRGYFSH